MLILHAYIISSMEEKLRIAICYYVRTVTSMIRVESRVEWICVDLSNNRFAVVLPGVKRTATM